MNGKVLAIPYISPCVRMFIESLVGEEALDSLCSSSLPGDKKDLVPQGFPAGDWAKSS
jgi:hypothetical protein